MQETNLFEARDLLHRRIKSVNGFLGITVNSKLGPHGIILIYLDTNATKERFKTMLGEQQYGFYIDYNVQEGLKFA